MNLFDSFLIQFVGCAGIIMLMFIMNKMINMTNSMNNYYVKECFGDYFLCERVEKLEVKFEDLEKGMKELKKN
jgi:hypothetical protein